MFGRPQPGPDRRIIYTVIYEDSKATERYRMTQRLLNGEDIDPKDPGWEAFKDPYWNYANSDYRPPEEPSENQSSEYGNRQYHLIILRNFVRIINF